MSCTRALAATACLTLASLAQAAVVNINGTGTGFAFPTDPAPVVGQVITPISNLPGGALNQLTLGPGTYRIQNAFAQQAAGADPGFSGWRFNDGANWVWNFVIADDASHQVVFYGQAGDAFGGGVYSTQAGIAAQQDVIDYSAFFTLAQTTTLDFMVRDYYLLDNAGGVSLLITEPGVSQGVPEPTPTALLLAALAAAALARRKAA